jgi:hypothetical protein
MRYLLCNESLKYCSVSMMMYDRSSERVWSARSHGNHLSILFKIIFIFNIISMVDVHHTNNFIESNTMLPSFQWTLQHSPRSLVPSYVLLALGPPPLSLETPCVERLFRSFSLNTLSRGVWRCTVVSRPPSRRSPSIVV